MIMLILIQSFSGFYFLIFWGVDVWMFFDGRFRWWWPSGYYLWFLITSCWRLGFAFSVCDFSGRVELKKIRYNGNPFGVARLTGLRSAHARMLKKNNVAKAHSRDQMGQEVLEIRRMPARVWKKMLKKQKTSRWHKKKGEKPEPIMCVHVMQSPCITLLRFFRTIFHVKKIS